MYFCWLEAPVCSVTSSLAGMVCLPLWLEEGVTGWVTVRTRPPSALATVKVREDCSQVPSVISGREPSLTTWARHWTGVVSPLPAWRTPNS